MCSRLVVSVCFFLLLPFHVLAKNSDLLETGIAANEKLINFLLTHQCQVGLIETCQRKPLSPKELQVLKDSFLQLSYWKEEVVEKYLPENDWIEGRKFKLIKGTNFALVKKIILNPVTLKKEEQLVITLGEDSISESAVTKIRSTASLQLVIYDHFLRIAQLFSRASHLGTIISTDLPAEGKIFEQTFSSVLSDSNWRRTERLLTFLNESKKIIPPSMDRFDNYINASFTAKRISERDVLFYAKTIILFRTLISQNNLLVVLNKIGGELSRIFGNNVGKIQMRSGKLKPMADDPVKMASLKHKLQPLDILFERTPFRLTDVFIPGHYGHIAIWLGSPEELMEMTVSYNGGRIPLLDHPLVQPHLEKLSQGRLVLEALREPGVTLNTLEHFMDIDDLLVTRPVQINDPGEFLLKAFEQVGKPYDFNFDVETDKSIVCSELIYRVFDNVTWPTASDLGRYTISPDHVAWKTVDTCYDIQLMYHNGKEVQENMGERLEQLLLAGSIKYSRDSRCD